MRYELFEEVYSISSNDVREHRQVGVLNRAEDDDRSHRFLRVNQNVLV